MTFVNRYNKEDSINYFYTSEFLEGEKEIILSIGQEKGNGLITFIDNNGNLINEKTYAFEQDNKVIFKKVIQVEHKDLNESIYIIYAKGGQGHYLMAVSNVTAGINLLWQHKLDISYESNVFIQENKEEPHSFILVYSSTENTKEIRYPTISVFSYNGTSLRVSQVETLMVVNDIDTFHNGIVLGGFYLDKEVSNYIVDLKYDFSLSKCYKISDPAFKIESVRYTIQGYLISGYVERNDTSFISLISKEGSMNTYELSNTVNHKSQVELNELGFYLLTYTDTHGTVHKFNWQFEINWSKELNSGSSKNGIASLKYNLDTHRLLTTAYNEEKYSIVVSTLGNFSSCITKNIQFPTVSKLKCNVGEYTVGIRDSGLKYSKWPVIGKTISSKKEVICKPEDGNGIFINENTSLQSPTFYLQGAGSTGEDSTKGIHLRWIFSGALGEKHIPKGNYSNNSNNFNRASGDFVKIYRTPYIKNQFTLDLSLIPTNVIDSQQYWMYKFTMGNFQRTIYVIFKNSNQYDLVRASINPKQNPQGFIKSYGNELIEVENKKELFFASELEVSTISPMSSLQLEGLSVSENKIFVPKGVSYRKTFSNEELPVVRFVSENGRSIRFVASDCAVKKIRFEYYSDFITEVSNDLSWKLLGDFALTNESNIALKRLDPEPTSNPVHGKWLRFNDEAYVNTENYVNKWSGETEYDWQKNIQATVDRYIELSESLDNPKANEVLEINFALENNSITIEPGEPDEGNTQISNLDMLRLASYDFHVARMLGLGTLDIAPIVFEGEYIYLAEYYSYGDLEDGLGDRIVHHLSMSLPTSIQTQRLPVPLEIKSVTPGYPSNNEGESSGFTDEQGYSLDGKVRFVSIFSKDLPEGNFNPPFFETSDEYDASINTLPIFGGVKHKVMPIVEGGAQFEEPWSKPELSHTKKYLNIDSDSNSFETIFLNLPKENKALYIHKQTETGTHFYSTYAINWFSRVNGDLNKLNIETVIKPTNLLKPPSDVNTHLIVSESPLMFTSQNDQERLRNIEYDDKTLVRLQFNYDSRQDIIVHQLPLDTVIDDEMYLTDPDSLFPDDDEVFADKVEIFFRNKTPRVMSAKVHEIAEHPSNVSLCIFKTVDYHQYSTGGVIVDSEGNENYTPEILPASFPEGTTAQNFIGSIMLVDNQQFVVHSIENSNEGLDFTVYKKRISQGILGEDTSLDSQGLERPTIQGDGLFVVTENMQEENNWDLTTNPHNLLVEVNGYTSDKESENGKKAHREIIYTKTNDGTLYKYLEKTRGIWGSALIERVTEEYKIQGVDGDLQNVTGHRGLYKVTFDNLQLEQHSQFISDGVSVEWLNGTIRMFTEDIYNNGEPRESRKVFQVFRTEHIGTTNNLVLYFQDPNFPIDELGNPNPTVDFDEVLLGRREVNYYPGYKVYLYQDMSHNLTEDIILPDEGEGNRYSIFGLRVVDYDTLGPNNEFYKSHFSVPAVMYAQEIISAKTPQQPQGALYATRPDYFGKSTYTFITGYSHTPHGVMFCRADNQAFLGALYEASIKPGEDLSTLGRIKQELELLGGNDEIRLTDRWENFLDFTQLREDGTYTDYPMNEENGYAFPLPDRKRFFEGINRFIEAHNDYYNQSVSLINEIEYGTLLLNHIIIPELTNVHGELKLIDFVKDAIHSTFVPLTEIPILYTEIDAQDPINKKQNIRDKDGYLLTPEDENFIMAPMVKKIGDNKTYFTDFTLDGTSNNIYFYGVREVGSLMKMSDFSPFIGPVKLVNSNPPEPPKVKSLLPTLENRVLGITPKVEVQVNAYPKVQNIKKLNLYRASNRLDAESILSMQHIKTIDVETSENQNENVWKVYDDFSDLEETPFGDAFYYRVTVSRKVEYAKTNYNLNYDTPTFEIVTEYAPSLPSKIGVTLLTEVYNPSSPILSYTSNELNIGDNILYNICIKWKKTCYKGKYHVYKMNNQGTWKQIAKLESDNQQTGLYHTYKQVIDSDGIISWIEAGTVEQTPSPDSEIVLPLNLTNLGSLNLNIVDESGNPIYHHFKVVAENTSGMFSVEEKTMTIGYFEEEPLIKSYKLTSLVSNPASGVLVGSNTGINPIHNFRIAFKLYSITNYHSIMIAWNGNIKDGTRLFFTPRRGIYFGFGKPGGVTKSQHKLINNVQPNVKYEVEMKYNETLHNISFYIDGEYHSTIDNVIPTRDFGGSQRMGLLNNIEGEIYPFMLNGEEFRLTEGSGTTVTGENGTVLNLLGAVNWEEI